MFDSYIRTNFSLFPKESTILSRYLDHVYTGLCRLPNLSTLYTYVFAPPNSGIRHSPSLPALRSGLTLTPTWTHTGPSISLYIYIYIKYKHIYLKVVTFISTLHSLTEYLSLNTLPLTPTYSTYLTR